MCFQSWGISIIYDTVLLYKVKYNVCAVSKFVLLSILGIIEPPRLIAKPSGAIVNARGTAHVTCTFIASEVPNLSICAWFNREGRITPSDKYHMKQAPVPGRDNKIACTLTVYNVSKIDEGKLCCYCYYNETFWKEYHIPEHTNISSLCGEAKLQLAKSMSW